MDGNICMQWVSGYNQSGLLTPQILTPTDPSSSMTLPLSHSLSPLLYEGHVVLCVCISCNLPVIADERACSCLARSARNAMSQSSCGSGEGEDDTCVSARGS